MRKAIYRDSRKENCFPNVILELPHEMDKIPLPAHIAFWNKEDVKKPFILYYSHTLLYQSGEFTEIKSEL